MMGSICEDEHDDDDDDDDIVVVISYHCAVLQLHQHLPGEGLESPSSSALGVQHAACAI